MPSPHGGDQVGYSFVIPTLGRAATLRTVLLNVAGAVTAPYEVVVVYDGDNARLERELRHTMKLLPPGVGSFVPMGGHQGVAAARNAGIAKASLRHCVFLDDDVELTADWWHAVSGHATSDTACITGPILTRENSMLARMRAQRYEARYESLSTGDEVSFLAGGNSVVPRADLVALGGFPLVKVGSDSLLIDGLRSRQIACRFVREMGVYHRHDRGAWRAISNAFRAGRNVPSAKALRDEADHWRLAARNAEDVRVSLLNAALLAIKSLGFLSRGRGA